MMLTRDYKQSGLVEDLEIALQILVDQANIKLKSLIRKGIALLS
jgi:hypothetical protein